MKRYLFFLLFPLLAEAQITITYDPSPGRFGDQLCSYLHAKWVSYRYGLPLLYKPFLYSDTFMLHEIEEPWTEEKQKQFEFVVSHRASALEKLVEYREMSILYYIPFFSSLEDDLVVHPDWFTFPIDWKDPGFRKELRALFAVRKEHKKEVVCPKDCMSVAVHIRWDDGQAYLLYPKRFPQMSYYVEALTKLYSLFPHEKIYAHIFTDSKDPAAIVRELQKDLWHLPIFFGYTERDQETHVLSDFLEMMQFDGLIRSDSNYSRIPALIADYKVVMSPKHHIWVVENFAAKNYIDEIDVEINPR